MPARSGYEHTPEFWHAYLACSVGNHLHGNQPEDQLADDYERFLGSPGCSATLRRLIPGPLSRKKVKT
jgi:hypothetical protein